MIIDQAEPAVGGHRAVTSEIPHATAAKTAESQHRKHAVKEKRRTRHELFGRDPSKRAERYAVNGLMQKVTTRHFSPKEIDAIVDAVSVSSQKHNMTAHLDRVQGKGSEILLKPMTLGDITEIDSQYLTAKLKEHTQETWRKKAEERRLRVKSSGEKYNKSMLPQKFCKGPSGPGFAAGRGRPEVVE